MITKQKKTHIKVEKKNYLSKPSEVYDSIKQKEYRSYNLIFDDNI
jgi:hypothetical protein